LRTPTKDLRDLVPTYLSGHFFGWGIGAPSDRRQASIFA